jgi:hypothetical protein
VYLVEKGYLRQYELTLSITQNGLRPSPSLPVRGCCASHRLLVYARVQRDPLAKGAAATPRPDQQFEGRVCFKEE